MIPAYNEEECIGSVIESLAPFRADYDVVVIDDGSEDDTAAKAKQAGVTVVSLPFHAGGTTAVICGYIIALENDYDYLVKIDGDGQHRVEDLPRFIEPLRRHEADVVVGSRYLNGMLDKDALVKSGGRVFSSYIVGSLVKEFPVTDTTCGYRAWNRRALSTLLPIYLNWRRLPEDSVLWLTETVECARTGLEFRELPIQVLPRLRGESKSFSHFRMMRYPLLLMSTYIRLARRKQSQ